MLDVTLCSVCKTFWEFSSPIPFGVWIQICPIWRVRCLLPFDPQKKWGTLAKAVAHKMEGSGQVVGLRGELGLGLDILCCALIYISNELNLKTFPIGHIVHYTWYRSHYVIPFVK